ncbi:MAG: 50S ribosomal protein L30 [Nitrososphaerales archaeon]
MAYLVVRIRGTVNVPLWADTTLQLLNLDKKFRATIVPEEASFVGMLKKVKNYVAWCKADKETVRTLIEKRARKKGYKKIESSDIRTLGYNSIDELADALANGRTTLSKLDILKPWFALEPPKKGFKRSTKRMYQNEGVSGENQELPLLIKNMI